MELGLPPANGALTFLLDAVVAVAVGGAGLARRALGGRPRAGGVLAAVPLTAAAGKKKIGTLVFAGRLFV